MHSILTDFQRSAKFVILNTISLNNRLRLWIVALHHEHFPQAQLFLFIAWSHSRILSIEFINYSSFLTQLLSHIQQFALSSD